MGAERQLNGAMDEEAFEWASKIDGGLSPAEQAELNAWLAADSKREWQLASYQYFYAQVRGSVPVLAEEGRLDGARTQPRRLKSTRAWASALATAAALALGAFLVANRADEIATAAATRNSVVLTDGTRADLNARTDLEVRMRRNERVVRLRNGEAFFAVARDESRPFLVETDAGVVRVTGTEFNVRVDGPGGVEVTVLEGSVSVRTADKSGQQFQLKPRDQVVLTPGRATTAVLSTTAAENLVAWREGRIVFDETPLHEACARFASFHNRTVVVDPAIANLTIGGRYTLDDFDDFIVSLERSLPVKARKGDNGLLRLVGTEQLVR
jgi:transmembrane sensor